VAINVELSTLCGKSICDFCEFIHILRETQLLRAGARAYIKGSLSTTQVISETALPDEDQERLKCIAAQL